jgi:hypothetical protein
MGRASCSRPLVEAVQHSESVSEVKVASRQRLDSEVVGDVEMGGRRYPPRIDTLAAVLPGIGRSPDYTLYPLYAMEAV